MSYGPLFQYQARAEPVLVEAQAETITLDKWIGSAEVPQRRAAATPASETIAPLEPSLIVAQNLDWLREIETPQAQLQRDQLAAGVWPVFVPTPFDWLMPASEPQRKAAANVANDSRQNVEPIATGLSVFDWFRGTEQPTLPPHPRQQGQCTPVLEPSLTTVPPLDWMQPDANAWQRQPARLPAGVEGGVYQGVPIAPAATAATPGGAFTRSDTRRGLDRQPQSGFTRDDTRRGFTGGR